MTLSDDDIERLQAIKQQHNKNGNDAGSSREKLSSDMIESIVGGCVLSSRPSHKSKHLLARAAERDDPWPACNASVADFREWRWREFAKLNGAFGWCDKCRAIAYERYRP